MGGGGGASGRALVGYTQGHIYLQCRWDNFSLTQLTWYKMKRIKIKPVFIGLQFAGKSPTFVHLLHVLGDVFRFLFCPDNSTRRPHKHQVNWSAKQAFYQTCNWKEFAGIEPARSTQPTTRPQLQTNIINSRIVCVKEIESNSDIKWFHSELLYFKCSRGVCGGIKLPTIVKIYIRDKLLLLFSRDQATMAFESIIFFVVANAITTTIAILYHLVLCCFKAFKGRQRRLAEEAEAQSIP